MIFKPQRNRNGFMHVSNETLHTNRNLNAAWLLPHGSSLFTIFSDGDVIQIAAARTVEVVVFRPS